MLPSGHLAVTYLLHRYGRINLKIGALAALFPDLVDKPLKMVLGLETSGRTWAHGLPAVLLVSLVVLWWWGRTAGYSWFMGHLFHLLADYPLTSNVPWLFPFVPYRPSMPGTGLLISGPELMLDAAAVVLVIGLYWHDRRKARTGGG